MKHPAELALHQYMEDAVKGKSSMSDDTIKQISSDIADDDYFGMDWMEWNIKAQTEIEVRYASSDDPQEFGRCNICGVPVDATAEGKSAEAWGEQENAVFKDPYLTKTGMHLCGGCDLCGRLIRRLALDGGQRLSKRRGCSACVSGRLVCAFRQL